MKISRKGQVTIPPALRKKHGLQPACDVKLIDQPNGVLVIKAGEFAPGNRHAATHSRPSFGSGDRPVATRHGVPLARNDGLRMTAAEVSAMLAEP